MSTTDEETEAIVKYLQGEGTQKEWGEKLGVSASKFGTMIEVEVREVLEDYSCDTGYQLPVPKGYLIEGLEDAGWIRTSTEAREHADIIVPLIKGEAPTLVCPQYEYISRLALPSGMSLHEPILCSEEGEWPDATQYKRQVPLMNQLGKQGFRFVGAEPTEEEAFEWVPIEGQDDKVRKKWYSLVRCFFEREMF